MQIRPHHSGHITPGLQKYGKQYVCWFAVLQWCALIVVNVCVRMHSNSFCNSVTNSELPICMGPLGPNKNRPGLGISELVTKFRQL